MRAALDFSLKYGRSQHKQEHVPVDIGHFIDMTFPGVARVKMLPTEFPSITHDGKGLWSVKQSQHVVLVDDHITKWINSLQMTDYLYFDPSSRQVGMSELCLKYISSIPNFEAMTEVSATILSRRGIGLMLSVRDHRGLCRISILEICPDMFACSRGGSSEAIPRNVCRF